MPELAEVETLRRQLAREIRGKTIRELVVLDGKLGGAPPLEGRRVADLRRHGKFLEIVLDDGSALELHLRMTGRLVWREDGAAATHPARQRSRGSGDISPVADRACPAHTRFRLVLEDGEILCVDPRRFATLALGKPHPAGADRHDPLARLDPPSLHRAARSRRLAVKAFLLDQSVFPGMGNIYACEILHAAGVDPRKATSTVRRDEWKAIACETERILARAVRCRGTSMSDWRDLHGRPGTYQDHLLVYGRKGESCFRCGTVIERIVLGGRGTWFCPGCQK
jgi:formamidopyrimidine-DNA glycosylase